MFRSTSDLRSRPVQTPPTPGRGELIETVSLPPSLLVRLRVKSVENDHLVCRTWNGTSEGTIDILVAKPFPLRRTPYHGKTISYSQLGAGTIALTYTYSNGYTRSVAKGGGGSETQRIVPAYVGTGTGYDGEEIWAVRCKSGVVLNEGETDEQRLSLMDANFAGRMWAKQ